MESNLESLYTFNRTSPIGLCGLIWNILLLLALFSVSFFWYLAQVYSPQLMFYQYYSAVFMICSYITGGYSGKESFFVFQTLFGALTVVVMCFYLNELVNASLPDDKYEGVIQYSQYLPNFKNVYITSQNATTYPINNTYLISNIVLAGICMLYGFLHFIIGVMAFMNTVLDDRSFYFPMRHNQVGVDKVRLAGTYLAIIATCLNFGLICASFWAVSIGVLAISPFSTSQVLMVACVFFAIVPPPPEPPYDEKASDTPSIIRQIWFIWALDNNSDKYKTVKNEMAARQIGKVSTIHIFYLVLFSFAILFMWIELGLLVSWRSSNDLSPICYTNITEFEEVVLNHTRLQFFGWKEYINYTEITNGPHNAIFFGTFTCADDWIRIIQLVFGMIIYCNQISLICRRKTKSRSVESMVDKIYHFEKEDQYSEEDDIKRTIEQIKSYHNKLKDTETNRLTKSNEIWTDIPMDKTENTMLPYSLTEAL